MKLLPNWALTVLKILLPLPPTQEEREAAILEQTMGHLEQAANNLQTLERPEASIDLLKILANENPNNPTYYKDLGELCFESGRKEEAIEHFKKAAELTPENHKLHRNLGYVYFALRYPEKALTHYKKAADLKPDNGLYHSNIAALCVDLRRYEEGKTHGRRALDLNPENAITHANYADCCYRTDEREKAKEHYKKAIELGLTGNEAAALNNFGVLHENIDNTEEAWLYYKKALNMTPKDTVILENLGKNFLKSGWYEAAQRHFANVVDLINEEKAENIDELLNELGIEDNDLHEGNLSVCEL